MDSFGLGSLPFGKTNIRCSRRKHGLRQIAIISEKNLITRAGTCSDFGEFGSPYNLNPHIKPFPDHPMYQHRNLPPTSYICPQSVPTSRLISPRTSYLSLMRGGTSALSSSTSQSIKLCINPALINERDIFNSASSLLGPDLKSRLASPATPVHTRLWRSADLWLRFPIHAFKPHLSLILIHTLKSYPPMPSFIPQPLSHNNHVSNKNSG